MKKMELNLNINEEQEKLLNEYTQNEGFDSYEELLQFEIFNKVRDIKNRKRWENQNKAEVYNHDNLMERLNTLITILTTQNSKS